jgi:hypothetical protein
MLACLLVFQLLLVGPSCQDSAERAAWEGWRHYRTKWDTYALDPVYSAYLVGRLGLPLPEKHAPRLEVTAAGALSWNKAYALLVLAAENRLSGLYPRSTALIDSSGTVLWSRYADFPLDPRVSDGGIGAFVMTYRFPRDSVPQYVIARIDSVIKAEGREGDEVYRFRGIAAAAHVLDSIGIEFIGRDGETIGVRKWPFEVVPPVFRGSRPRLFHSMGFVPQTDIFVALSRQKAGQVWDDHAVYIDAMRPDGEHLWSYGPSQLSLDHLMLDTRTDAIVAFGGHERYADGLARTPWSHNACVALRSATGELIGTFDEVAQRVLHHVSVDSSGQITFRTDSLWSMDLSTGKVRSVGSETQK